MIIFHWTGLVRYLNIEGKILEYKFIPSEVMTHKALNFNPNNSILISSLAGRQFASKNAERLGALCLH